MGVEYKNVMRNVQPILPCVLSCVDDVAICSIQLNLKKSPLLLSLDVLTLRRGNAYSRAGTSSRHSVRGILYGSTNVPRSKFDRVHKVMKTAQAPS